MDYSLQKLNLLGKRIDKIQKFNRRIGTFYNKKTGKLKKNFERNVSSLGENMKKINWSVSS